MNNKYSIGCSGYYYSAWKNKFYPQGMPPKNWLAYYSSVFNSVELNSTFYRTPKLPDLQKYTLETPVNFKFSIKMSKYITHILKLKDSKQHINDFQNLIFEGLSDKASYFLFQLPSSFRYNEGNLERIINNIPHLSNNIIEFRHESWWNIKVAEVLKNIGLTFCNIDFPGLKTSFIFTSSMFYLRLHGNPELYKSLYTEAQIKSFYNLFPVFCNDYAVYFNNT